MTRNPDMKGSVHMSLYEHGFDGSSDQGGHDMNDQMNQNGQMNQKCMVKEL